MNRFAIDENDQFEIAAFQSLFQSKEIHVHFDVNKTLQAVENVSMKQMEGLYYFYRTQFYMPGKLLPGLLLLFHYW